MHVYGQQSVLYSIKTLCVATGNGVKEIGLSVTEHRPKSVADLPMPMTEQRSNSVADLHMHMTELRPNSVADLHISMAEVERPIHVRPGRGTGPLLNISAKPGQTSASTALAEPWPK